MRAGARSGLAAGAFTALLLAAACSGGGGGRDSRGADASGASGAGGGDALMPAEDFREVLLLFASPEDDRLRAERRDLPWNPSVEVRARQAVAALIEGPAGDLLPVLPAGSVVRELFILKDGTAVVDFGKFPGAAGSAAEYTAIYAVVDTLALNFSEIRRVGFLVDGEEPETLLGHIDTRYPFAPSTAPLQAALAVRLRTILAERGEDPVEGPEQAPAPSPTPGLPPGPGAPGTPPGQAPIAPGVPGAPVPPVSL